MLCSLLWPPSLPKQLPLVMHGHECAMYEEPCLGFAVMMVHEVRGLVVLGVSCQGDVSCAVAVDT